MQELDRRLKYYTFDLLLIWLALFLYRTNKYYKGFLAPETQQLLLWLAIAYTVLALLFFLFVPLRHLQESKGATIFRASRRFFSEARHYLRRIAENPTLPRIEPHEKTAFLFALVKLFFLPIMTNFIVSNWHGLQSSFAAWQLNGFAFSMQAFNSMIFPLLLTLFFAVDTLWFTFGYAVEFSWLGNKVRSVEPTLFGWAVALICYPPFNGVMGFYVNWYPNDYASFHTVLPTFILKLVLIALYFVYVWATLALGAKSSNLTNRGIVSSGPYAFIRHPAYISKNMAWAITLIPLMNFGNPKLIILMVLSVAAWATIYFFRAITEERHLIKDPDYQEYCRKVKYRFIPFVF